MPLNRYEGVAIAKVMIVFKPDPLLFLADETPHLIGFHVTHLDIANLRRHNAFALFASEYQQLQDRAVVDAGNALDSRNAVSSKSERTISAFSIGKYMPSR